MNIDKKLAVLQQIKQVDAPPFLLTRIWQQIETLGNVAAPVKWKWAFAASSILILAFNIAVLFKSNEKAEAINGTGGIERVVQSMNLTTTNQLYNE